MLRQVVRRRPGQQQEERVEAAEEAAAVGAVELCVLEAHPLQRLDALGGLGHQVVAEPKLDGVGGTGLGAGGPEAVVDAVVTEGALLGGARLLVERHDAERARGHAVAAAVADVLVDVDGAVLGPVDGAGGTRVETPRLRAVLADVGHEQPGEITVGFGAGRLDEPYEPERFLCEVSVVLVRARPLGRLEPELVPLLARHLTGPTADAQGRVREHRQRARHGYTTPFFTLQTKAFVSWMKTLGSPTVDDRSLVMSPLLPGSSSTPFQPQCHGTPMRWTVLPSMVKGLIRLVTIAVTCTLPRGLATVTFSPFWIPSSLASSWLISAKCEWCSSASMGRYRDMTPERWCSVRRYVVMTYG